MSGSAITIGGQLVELEGFSGFKAMYAMDTIGTVEATVRDLIRAHADFKAEHTARVVQGRTSVRFTRVEARRQFGPQPLYEQQPTDDGPRLIAVLNDGAPVMGPDPLGHLTDQDWQACGNELVIPTIPAGEDDGIENAAMMAMAPLAFKQARGVVTRLLALATTTNRQLEDWDDANADIDAELDKEAKKLAHRASGGELIALAVAAVQLAKDEIAGPFEDAVAAIQQLFPSAPADPTSVPAQQPMRLESEPDAGTTSSPGSATSSPASTAGPPATPSTEPAGVS
jgi:hypothetical protein